MAFLNDVGRIDPRTTQAGLQQALNNRAFRDATAVRLNDLETPGAFSGVRQFTAQGDIPTTVAAPAVPAPAPAPVPAPKQAAPDTAATQTPRPSRIGLSGAEGITQIDPNASFPVVALQRSSAGARFNDQLAAIRDKIIPVPGKVANRGFFDPRNLVATGINEGARSLEFFLGANKTRRDEINLQEQVHTWFGGDTFGGGEGKALLAANPGLIAEASVDPIAFFHKYAGKPGAAQQVPAQQVPAQQVPQAGVAAAAAVTARPPTSSKAGVAPIDKNSPVHQALTKAKPPVPRNLGRIPGLLNKEMQNGLAQLHLLQQEARSLRGTPAAAGAIRKANYLAATLTHLAQQKAVIAFEKGGDPRLLMQMWSKDSGRNYVLRPRSDGKWNIEVDGQPVREGVTASEIANKQRTSMSSVYSDSIDQAQIAHKVKLRDAKQAARAKADIAIINGLSKVEAAKQFGKFGMKPDPKGDGSVFQIVDGVLFHHQATVAKDQNGDPQDTFVTRRVAPQEQAQLAAQGLVATPQGGGSIFSSALSAVGFK